MTRGRIGGSRLFSAAAFTLALFLVVGAAISADLNVKRLRNSFDWVSHTQKALLQIGSIETCLAYAIAAQREYLLTNAPDKLANFRRFSADLRSQLDGVEQQLTDPIQQQRLDELRPLVERRLHLLEEAVSEHVTSRQNVARTLPSDEETQARAAIRDILLRFRDAEVDLLNKRQQEADRDATASNWFAIANVVLALGAAALGVFALQRERERSRTRELQAELVHVSRLNAVGQYGSMLAHEVNQPLTAARNFLAVAQRMLRAEALEPGRVADAVDRTLTQVDRATDIIRHLRQFVSRSGPDRSREPVAAVISEAIAVSGLESKGARIVQQIASDLPLASIGKIQIQQVLVNLMRNSLEAMVVSERKDLTIVARRLDRSMIQISVKDTGPGLPNEVAAKLFQPFVTTKEGGMGVGLSICRTIVEAHGGRIWAEQGLSDGAVFHFTVPAAAGAEKTETDRGVVTTMPWPLPVGHVEKVERT